MNLFKMTMHSSGDDETRPYDFARYVVADSYEQVLALMNDKKFNSWSYTLLAIELIEVSVHIVKRVTA